MCEMTMALLNKCNIGKRFIHKRDKREYKIIDVYQTRSAVSGRLIREVYVTECVCAGQIVRGEMPSATITLSVQKNGWLES
jgi:hypothetical protein